MKINNQIFQIKDYPIICHNNKLCNRIWVSIITFKFSPLITPTLLALFNYQHSFSCLWNSGPFLRGHFFLSSLSNLKSLKMAPLPRRQRLECRMNGMGVVTIILCQPKTFGEQFVVVGFRSYMSNVAVQFCSHKPTKQWTTRSGGSPMGERGAREKRTDEGNCWIWHFFYWLYWGKVFLHLINGVMRTHVPLSCCLPCLSCRLWDFMCCSVEMGLF